MKNIHVFKYYKVIVIGVTSETHPLRHSMLRLGMTVGVSGNTMMIYI
jgi:hypothetical protein